ncbi:kinase-like domain-containing protein, partial [Gigaspora rosea]
MTKNQLIHRLYGTCEECGRYNTYYAWCQKCDSEKTVQEWSVTSEDEDVDNCIKGFQRKATMHEEVIEWIPFDRLIEIKRIAEGGFGLVFSAIWLDGIRVTRLENNGVKSREKSSMVALKTLDLNEFKNHVHCRLMGIELGIYGLTKCTENNKHLGLEAGKYLMVLQFAESGSLNQFLENNDKFKELTWKTKLFQLLDISSELAKIHKAGYTHNDLHSGNILQIQYDKTVYSYISDLGSSKKIEEYKERNQGEEIFGVMPYVAPEVLQGENYTPAADIYGLGIIMAQMSSGQRPF